MSAIGGSIRQISVKNRIFSVTADSDVNIGLGQKMNDVEANGDATARVLQTQEPWMIDGAALVIDPANGDLEFLRQVANEGRMVDITITLVSGVAYGGKGIPTGEIRMSSQSSTAPVAFKGEGELSPL